MKKNEKPFFVRYSAKNVDKKHPNRVETFTTCITAASIAEARAKLAQLKAWHRRRRDWKFSGVPRSEIEMLGAS